MISKSYKERKYGEEEKNFLHDLPEESPDIFIPGRMVNILHRESRILLSGRLRNPHLDVGCHQGRLLLRLAQEKFNVYGIDASKTAVKIVLENARKMRIPLDNSNVYHGLVENLPWEDYQFGSITCCQLLEHLETKVLLEKAVKELWRILRPGGYLHITVPCADDHWAPDHFIQWDTPEDIRRELINPKAVDATIERLPSSDRDWFSNREGVFYITQRRV